MVKNLPANAGDPGLISESGRIPEKGNGNPLQYSCRGNPMDSGAGGYSPWGHKKAGLNLPTKQQHFRYYVVIHK